MTFLEKNIYYFRKNFLITLLVKSSLQHVLCLKHTFRISDDIEYFRNIGGT